MAVSDTHSSTPQVAILMATYNGAKFLAEQLDSIADQTYSNWRVVVSDDGSSDETLAILAEYQKAWGQNKLEIRRGPRIGYCANFLSLACDKLTKADYYAFCDQDDVWLPNKLKVAVDYLNAHQNAGPYLYCGRTHYVDVNLKPRGASPLFPYPRSFRNALVQSIAGGNTMVFNQGVKALLEQVGPVNVVSHDWWVYMLTTGAGGVAFYDTKPEVLYRQHCGNLIGENTSALARFERLTMLMQGRFRAWNTMNVAALQRARVCLSEESIDILDEFVRLRDSTLLHRFRMIEVCGLYRQTWRGTISLIVAAFLKKI